MLTIVNGTETHAGAAGPPAGMARKARVSAADAGTGSGQARGPIRIVLPWLCIPQIWRSASGLVLFAFVFDYNLGRRDRLNRGWSTHHLHSANDHGRLDRQHRAHREHRPARRA